MNVISPHTRSYLGCAQIVQSMLRSTSYSSQVIERQLLITLPTHVLFAVGVFGLILRCADAYLMKRSEKYHEISCSEYRWVPFTQHLSDT